MSAIRNAFRFNISLKPIKDIEIYSKNYQIPDLVRSGQCPLDTTCRLDARTIQNKTPRYQMFMTVFWLTLQLSAS